MSAFVVGIASVFKTVTVRRPGREEEEFIAEIRVHDRDEQDAIQERQKNDEITATEQIRSDLLSITGLQDKDGNSVEATPELMEKMYKCPYAGNGIMRAWYQVQNGLPEETAKN
ncbi:hypothetical protein [Vreelandella populi]|uniref:hypothetical protein n=1 Tax=Vreelandella populi TaxID=2498858 RepID=UPI000F8DB92F|nr:hypothetical protein [Halomonas populi]RUR51528.1 hypothetical protein ELY40_17175 [Halomonas populi]